MPTTSAGLLLFRRRPHLEVLLVHPGGPYWERKDAGAWSIPKGEVDDGDDPHATAVREFAEELGSAPPVADPPHPDIDLGEVRQRGGKVVRAWAREGDLDVTEIRSNTFELEWPPRSGRRQVFPEVDRAAWSSPEDAAVRLISAQVELVDRLVAHLGRP